MSDIRRKLNEHETLDESVAAKELFLGKCVGIALTNRIPGDRHICFRWLTEDDGNWFPGRNSWSTYWITEAADVINEVRDWLETHAVPDVPAGTIWDYEDDTPCGWLFVEEKPAKVKPKVFNEPWDGKIVQFRVIEDGRKFNAGRQRVLGKPEICPVCHMPLLPSGPEKVVLMISNQAGIPNRVLCYDCFDKGTPAYTLRKIAEDYAAAQEYAGWFHR